MGIDSDENWSLYNEADPTKQLKFSLAGLATTTLRTLSLPDYDGDIPVLQTTNFWTDSNYFSGFEVTFGDSSTPARVTIFGEAGAGDGPYLYLYDVFSDRLHRLQVNQGYGGERTWTLPDATTTLAGLSVSQTWTGANVFDADSNTPAFRVTAGGTFFALRDTGSGNDLSVVCSGTVNGTLTIPGAGGTVTLGTATQTLTNKRVSPRVTTMTDATSFTPAGDTTDMATQANTQAIGTLTANAPSGTPVNGQEIILRIKSTNVQTFAWNAIYRSGVTVTLPTTSTGGSKTDYIYLRYNSADSKWDCTQASKGY